MINREVGVEVRVKTCVLGFRGVRLYLSRPENCAFRGTFTGKQNEMK